MRSRIIKYISSIIYRTEKSPTCPQTPPAQQVLPPSNIYHSCSKLPMAAFLDALCEDNLQSLIIDGKVTPPQLNEAWVLILSEYYELRGDGIDGNEQTSLSRDILKLNNHLNILDVCVKFLLERYSDSIADSVRKLGYSFRPTSFEPIDYIVQLNTVVQKSKTKYVQLQQMLKQLEAKMAEGGKEKPKRETFEKNLLYYEEMQGASYNMDELTVSKYVMLEKKYDQKIEQLKAIHAK
jgi:hypothetical protein